jgi:hypothetical protein
VSNTLMRWMIPSFCFLLLASCLRAEPQSADKAEEAAIQRVKNTLASSLDSSVPKVSLEFFLKYESGGAPIQWEVNDCVEQAGNPPTDRSNDPPMCVEADFQKDQTDVTVMVSVGTLKKGPSGTPAVFSVTVDNQGGKSHSLRRLGDLPKELHRPAPKSPRDLPIPTTSSV